MQIKRWFGRYRRLFDLRRPVDLHVIDAMTNYSGLFVPGRDRDLILINLATTPDEPSIRATILHELIHAEQNGLDLDLRHDAYFKRRAAELQATTGLTP